MFQLLEKAKLHRKDRKDFDKQQLIMEAERAIQKRHRGDPRRRTLSYMASDPEHETSSMGSRLYGRDLDRKPLHAKAGISTSAPTSPERAVVRDQVIPAPASTPSRRAKVPMVMVKGPRSEPELALDAPPIIIKTRSPAPDQHAEIQMRSAPNTRSIMETAEYTEATTLPLRKRPPPPPTPMDVPPIVIKTKDPAQEPTYRIPRENRDYFSEDEHHVDMEFMNVEDKTNVPSGDPKSKDWDYDGDDDNVFLPTEPPPEPEKRKSKSVGSAPEYAQTVWVESEVPEEDEAGDKAKLLRKKVIKVKSKRSARVQPLEEIPMQEMVHVPLTRARPQRQHETHLVDMHETEIDIPVTRFWLAPPDLSPSAFIPVKTIPAPSTIEAFAPVPEPAPTSPITRVLEKPPPVPMTRLTKAPSPVERKRKKLPTPPPKDVAEAQAESARRSLIGLRKNAVSPESLSQPEEPKPMEEPVVYKDPIKPLEEDEVIPSPMFE